MATFVFVITSQDKTIARMADGSSRLSTGIILVPISIPPSQMVKFMILYPRSTGKEWVACF